MSMIVDVRQEQDLDNVMASKAVKSLCEHPLERLHELPLNFEM